MIIKAIHHLLQKLRRNRRSDGEDCADYDFFVELEDEETGAEDRSEESPCTPAGTMLFAHEELNLLHDLQAVLQAFSSRVEDTITILRELESGENMPAADAFGYAKALAVRFKSYAQRRVLRLYELVEDGSVFSDGVTVNTDAAAQNDYGIRACYHNNCIVLKLPMLGSCWRKTSTKTNQLSSEETYGTIFQRTISEEIQRLFAKNLNTDREAFRLKTLTFFFNNHAEDPYIMDSDNHQTKTITDAICSFLPGSDAGSTTSFFYAATINDSIPRGTYVVVSAGRFSAQNESFLTGMQAHFFE